MQAIPIALEMRDLIGIAETGSGTAAVATAAAVAAAATAAIAAACHVGVSRLQEKLLHSCCRC